MIFAIIGGRIALKNRSVRKYVRSVKQRIRSVEDRGAELMPESAAEKPQENGRTTAIQLQKVRTLINAAERAEAREKIGEAESSYIQALTAKPDAHEARAKLALLYLKLGRDQKAEAMYKEILSHIDDASCYSNLGVAYYRQGSYERACSAYQKALEKDPNNQERLASLGKSLFAAQRFPEAIECLEKATTRNGRNTELLRLLAKSCEKVGDIEKAVYVYKKVNMIEPYDEGVKGKIEALASY